MPNTHNPHHNTRLFSAGACLIKPLPPCFPNQELRRAQALRYQVYCLECQFLSPDDYPDGLESDAYDATAAHFYAYDEKNELVGYVRLIRPDTKQRFPFQDHCHTSTDKATLPLPGRAGEISRLMVRHDYRRLRGNPVAGERRHEALQVMLGLYRQMYAYSRTHGIGYWYAAMERALARSLQRLHFGFNAIGPQTDYYGPVAPYLAHLQTLESQLGVRDPDLLAWLQQPDQTRMKNLAYAYREAPDSRPVVVSVPRHKASNT